MAVYTGGCDALQCATYRFLGFLPLVWDTVEGETYSIFVYSGRHALRDIFSILAESTVRPPNDACDNAIALEPEAEIEGTTYSSESDAGKGLPTCGDVETLGTSGVWYTFTGDGSAWLVAVNAGSMNGTSIFDTQLSVYQGSCENATCVGGHDQASTYSNYENYVVVDSVEGETYNALVHGFEVAEGAFTIVLRPLVRPANDACDGAIALEIGDTVTGSTLFGQASNDFVFEECGTSNGTTAGGGPGIWYSVTGDGSSMTATVDAQYDMQLTVFSGACDSLTCVGGTEGNVGDVFAGEVTFDAAEGETYSILVHGYQGKSGTFELMLQEA